MAPARADSFIELPLTTESSEPDLEGTSDEQPGTRPRCRFGVRAIGKAVVLGLSSAAVVILSLPYANAFIWQPLFHRNGKVQSGRLGGAVSLNSNLQGQVVGMPGMPVSMSKGGLNDLVSLQDDELSADAMGLPGIPTANLGPEDECEDDEESFMTMCFRRCSSFHNGTYPVRRAPFACCQENCHSFSCCHYSAPIPGHGYFSAGSGGMPHVAGSCDANEEEFMGLCYKTCDTLSDHEYPRRVGANSCCKPAPATCLNVVFNVKTEGMGCMGYGVGGALEQGHQCPHAPTVSSSSSGSSSSNR
jgi:hypothetical protein